MEGILVDLNSPEEEAVQIYTDCVGTDMSLAVNAECEVGVDSAVGSLTDKMSEEEVGLDESVDCDIESVRMEDLIAQDGFGLLDEEFDFDLLDSPSSKTQDKSDIEDDDEDEIFFGPVGHTEKCVAAVIEESTPGAHKPLSPLTEKQMAELVKEAQRVAFKISKECGTDSKQKDESLTKQLGKMSVEGHTSSSTSSEEAMSPASRLRRETFCVNTSPLHLLPQNIQESMVVVKAPPADKHSVNQFTATANDSVKTKSMVRKPVARSSTFSVRGSKLPGSRQGQPTKEKTIGAGRFSGMKKQKTDVDDSVETCSIASDTSDTSTGIPVTGKRSLPQPSMRQSRLAVPVRASHKRTTSNSSASSIGSTSSIGSNHSDIPPPKPRLASTANGVKAPTSKLQLMRPGGILNRKLLKPERPSTALNKTGPIKAVAPVPVKGVAPALSQMKAPTQTTVQKSTISQCTPVKPDTMVQPKRLLQEKSKASPSTPKKSSGSSCSSMPPGTPASSCKSGRRRSFLPTPVKRSMSSTGTQSPRSVRYSSNSSVGSQRSLTAADSPVFDDENKYPGKTNQSRIGKSINFSESSPKNGRRPLVQHTPLIQSVNRKVSVWTPLKKQKPKAGDEFFACTKRLSNNK